MNSEPSHETEGSGNLFIDGEEHELDKMKGCGKLLPQGNASRAQVATVLARFLETIVK